LAGLFRQPVYAGLAGYEDVNDHEALSRDPAVRAVIGRKELKKNAAGSATVSRFETEIPASGNNLEPLAAINGAWVAGAMEARRGKVVLDTDSSESSVHGKQEGSACNGNFLARCYHPLSVFNQNGDCEGALLSPGNVHSAYGWQGLLEPIVENISLAVRQGAFFPGAELFQMVADT
jgi:hypothetical protein